MTVERKPKQAYGLYPITRFILVVIPTGVNVEDFTFKFRIGELKKIFFIN